jgi:Protein of unknown function (DUF3142)
MQLLAFLLMLYGSIFGCGLAQAQVQVQTVQAQDYDAYWLWAGVKSRPYLKQAKTLYVLQGQVEETGAPLHPRVRLIAQGGAITKISNDRLWLVYRAHNLRWTPAIYAQILQRIARWQRAGNVVAGIQIDFDSATKHLDEYAVFLADLRRRLPKEYRLGITGLLDWSSQGDPAALAALGGVVDEVILQTYQGRHTIEGYQDYLTHLDRIHTPFKIGIVENGEWQPPAALATNPYFQGYVVFLINPDI